MPGQRITAGDDLLLHQLARPVVQVENDAANWFDRFYFNLHPDGPGPVLLFGAGVYPNAGVADGYACLVTGDEQRNIRFSQRLGGNRAATTIGPLSWRVVEPLSRWEFRLDGSAEGFELDVQWVARTDPYAIEPVAVAHADGEPTEFAHFFQAGRYEGRLVIDGEPIDVGGWYGMRDRSWGVRRTREKLGMHIWGGAQLPDRCLSVHVNEDRAGNTLHLDGAALLEGGGVVPVVGIEHALELDEGDELQRGVLRMTLADGEVVDVSYESLGRGVYMAGAGYGGWHGVDRGSAMQESERWPFDLTPKPRELSIGLVDKLCSVTSGGQTGTAIFELALSRSSSFSYRPTLAG